MSVRAAFIKGTREKMAPSSLRARKRLVAKRLIFVNLDFQLVIVVQAIRDNESSCILLVFKKINEVLAIEFGNINIIHLNETVLSIKQHYHSPVIFG